jgi:hypothetical protein
VFPWVGSLGVSGIKRAQITEVVQRIEKTGYVETADRVLQLIRSIFDYAIAEEVCEHSPCLGLSKTLWARPHLPSRDHHRSKASRRATEGHRRLRRYIPRRLRSSPRSAVVRSPWRTSKS